MTSDEAERLKQIIAYRNQGLSMQEICRLLGLPHSQVSLLLKDYVRADRARRGIA